MKASANARNSVSRPFIWSVAQYCLELPGGAVRHFPAGTYNDQVSTWIGQLELDLMNVAHNAWHTFIRLSLSDWGDGERRFAAWIAPRKEKPKPTRRLDDLILSLWGVSWWALRVLLPREDEP